MLIPPCYPRSFIYLDHRSIGCYKTRAVGRKDQFTRGSDSDEMINIEPPTATFPASGGNASHNIVSECDSKMAFKVKSSNNEHYRVRPVYGFVDAKAKSKLEIVRLEGPVKDDKLVILYAEVPNEETDPQAPFKAGAQQGEVILTMKAT